MQQATNCGSDSLTSIPHPTPRITATPCREPTPLSTCAFTLYIYPPQLPRSLRPTSPARPVPLPPYVHTAPHPSPLAPQPLPAAGPYWSPTAPIYPTCPPLGRTGHHQPLSTPPARRWAVLVTTSPCLPHLPLITYPPLHLYAALTAWSASIYRTCPSAPIRPSICRTGHHPPLSIAPAPQPLSAPLSAVLAITRLFLLHLPLSPYPPLYLPYWPSPASFYCTCPSAPIRPSICRTGHHPPQSTTPAARWGTHAASPVGQSARSPCNSWCVPPTHRG